jgi:hypothetical protein
MVTTQTNICFLLLGFSPTLSFLSLWKKVWKKLNIEKSIFSLLLSFCDVVLRDERALKNKNRQWNNSIAQTKLEIKNILFFQQRLFHLTSNTILKQKLRQFFEKGNFLSDEILWTDFDLISVFNQIGGDLFY